MNRCLLLACLAAVLALPGCGRPAAPAPSAPQKLNVSFSSASYAQIALPVAKESGTFDRNGLDVTLVFGSNGIPAMIAGEVQVASTSTEEVILADLGGADLEIVATQNTFMRHKVVVRPEIKTFADLKGRPVGITRRGTITDTALRMAAQKAGVDSNEFSLVDLGSAERQVQALAAGAVFAGVFTRPNSDVAIQNGGHLMYDFEPERVAYSGNSMIVSRAWAQKNERAVLAFLRSLAEASNMSRTDPELVKKVYAGWAKTGPEAAEIAVKIAAEEIPVKMPPTPEGIKFIQGFLAEQRPEAASADTSKFYDARYINQLEAEGFYRRFGQ